MATIPSASPTFWMPISPCPGRVPPLLLFQPARCAANPLAAKRALCVPGPASRLSCGHRPPFLSTPTSPAPADPWPPLLSRAHRPPAASPLRLAPQHPPVAAAGRHHPAPLSYVALAPPTAYSFSLASCSRPFLPPPRQPPPLGTYTSAPPSSFTPPHPAQLPSSTPTFSAARRPSLLPRLAAQRQTRGFGPADWEEPRGAIFFAPALPSGSS
uniref:Uncharacterized protein n=1 Tax=Setaria viridis TaxID=4556 RepID=A0A4U6UKU5_SETVI|nr:hypothetical protein SEVIR_5G196500v2 [Setaria viridis]